MMENHTTSVVSAQGTAQPAFYNNAPKRFIFMHHSRMKTRDTRTRGQRLREERKAQNLTQAKLSKLSKVSQQVISKIEGDGQDKTSASIKLASALGVNPEWLETGEGEKELAKWDLILDVSALVPEAQDAAKRLVYALMNGAISQDQFISFVRLIVPSDINRP